MTANNKAIWSLGNLLNDYANVKINGSFVVIIERQNR